MEKLTVSEFIAKYGNTKLLNGNHYSGYLDLRGCTGITSLPENLTVGGDLYLRGTGITSLPENLTVGGSLDLRGTGITSLPENLTVCGSLDLEGCTGITSLPENLTVGWSLYLRGTGITSLPENLTVGCSLDWDCGSKYIGATVNIQLPDVYTWRNGEYIKADGLFMKVLSRKGNVYRVCRIAQDEVKYLVTDGNGRWSHGDTLEEARKDLIYKISNRDTSRYKELTMDSVLSFEDAVECYRVITGACAMGTKHFVENVLASKDRKDSYTIREMVDLTKGQYGAETFADFFKK